MCSRAFKVPYLCIIGTDPNNKHLTQHDSVKGGIRYASLAVKYCMLVNFLQQLQSAGQCCSFCGDFVLIFLTYDTAPKLTCNQMQALEHNVMFPQIIFLFITIYEQLNHVLVSFLKCCYLSWFSLMFFWTILLSCTVLFYFCD